MQTELRYEDREVLPDFKKVIEKDFISITTDSTIFTRRTKVKMIERSEIEKELKLLKATCKEKDCKLKGQNKLSAKLKEIYPKYLLEFAEYEKTFNELCDLWKDHDLRNGYSDDIFYKEELQLREFKLQKMFYRSTNLSQVGEMLMRLKQLQVDFKYTNYTIINL